MRIINESRSTCKHLFITKALVCILWWSLIKQITESLNQKSKIACVFLDMTKAFDFVCHKTLLSKLSHYGIRGKANEWIESFLTDRLQCVEITRMCQKEQKTFRSKYRQNNFGTPQGGILSPLFFLTYINDLPEAIDEECVLFADDTTLIIKSDDNKDLEKRIVKALDKAILWLENNNLKINMTKTNIIQFQALNTNTNIIDIQYNNSFLSTVNDCVFLGITVDKNCSWKPHLDKILKKIDRFVYVLKRIKQTVDLKTALVAYHAYVASVLRYGLIIWGNSVDVQRVFKGQKKCIRAMCGAHFLDSCKPLFQKLKILSLPCLYIFEICIFVKKNYNLFEKNSYKINSRTRHKDRLKLPQIKLMLFKRNTYCMSVIVYNHLPNSTQDLPLPMFKRVLFRLLLEKNYYSLQEYLDDKTLLI